MAEVSWLELCYVLKLDVTSIPETMRRFFLKDDMRNTFLEVLTIYGKGYRATGNISLFNRWMRTERVYLGFLSPISMLGSPAGRELVHYWIKRSIWTGRQNKDGTTIAEFLDEGKSAAAISTDLPARVGPTCKPAAAVR